MLRVDSSCLWNQFACSKNKCIAKQWLCDGENDCEDGLDESLQICGESVETPLTPVSHSPVSGSTGADTEGVSTAYRVHREQKVERKKEC